MCEAHLKAAHDPEAPFAILVNAGNSNAFTGPAGAAKNDASLEALSQALGARPEECFLAATGVIGEPLPDPNFIGARVAGLGQSLAGPDWEACARAFMTTDTYPKGAGQTATLGETGVAVAGIAKGSGMIAPNMATMLAYIFTDAAIAPGLLQKLTSQVAEATFNSITVDGDTSTSDTLLVAATGASGIRVSEASMGFMEGLRGVMTDLAQQVVRDGEGASKFVEVSVTGASGDRDAHIHAMAIANSLLVKTAIAGQDPNWGRIVMAVGKSGAPADRDTLSIWFGDILVARDGQVNPDYREADAAAYMKRPEITIHVDIGLGGGTARVWTCDLTRGYIDINADYRS